jgi:hypothetical protein
MAIQLGTGLRNAMIGSYETTVGTAAYVKIFNGSLPADCQATTGAATLLCNVTLPSDWYNAASAGTCTKLGTWQGTAGAAGTAQFYRMYNNGTSVCSEQGTVGQGSGDLQLDNISIASSQVVTVTSWDRSIGGA